MSFTRGHLAKEPENEAVSLHAIGSIPIFVSLIQFYELQNVEEA